MATIERVRSVTRLELAEIAKMIAVTPETARKYAKGYQAASEAIIRLIDAIPDRLVARGDLFAKVLADRESAGQTTRQKAGDVSSTQQLAYILEFAEPGEIAIVRSVLDVTYRQCQKRDEKKPLAASEDSKIINIRQGQKTIPMYGDIAAGFPQEAIEQAEMFVLAPSAIAEKATYALRVRGVSMVDREINDGDLVAMDHRREPQDNDVVAALIDGQMTLKTYVSRGGKKHLKSENSQQPKKFTPVDELTIQGVMVANLGPA